MSVQQLVETWARSPALDRLVSAFGGDPGEQELAARLDWLEDFSLRWDYRAGAERNEVKRTDFEPERAALIVQAARELGLVGTEPPPHERYDHVLILGGLIRACFARPAHAARLLADGAITAGNVTALGGFRQLRGDELDLAAALGVRHIADEFEAMDAGARRAFGLDRPAAERGEASEELGASWRVHEYADGTAVQVVAAPSTEPGVRRANTSDTYKWFAEQLAELTPGQRILLVTTDIYRPYQHADAVRMLGLPYGVEIDVVGIRPGDVDPAFAQEFAPSQYLQEVRSTIRAMRMLLRAAA
jgi:hypothetical protein